MATISFSELADPKKLAEQFGWNEVLEPMYIALMSAVSNGLTVKMKAKQEIQQQECVELK